MRNETVAVMNRSGTTAGSDVHLSMAFLREIQRVKTIMPVFSALANGSS